MQNKLQCLGSKLVLLKMTLQFVQDNILREQDLFYERNRDFTIDHDPPSNTPVKSAMSEYD